MRQTRVANVPLLSGSVNSTSIFVADRTTPTRSAGQHQSLVISSGNFFDTMEMPFVPAVRFTEHDDQQAPKVAVINETAARKYFPEPESGRPDVWVERRDHRSA